MTEPYNEIFQHALLPVEKQSEKIYMFKWLKNDGDFVNENDELYILRIGEYQGFYYLPTQPIKCSKSGILEIRKVKDDVINSNDVICTIHFDDSHTNKLAIAAAQRKVDYEAEILLSLQNTAKIELDVFSNKKNISWQMVGGDSTCAVKSRSSDFKIDFYFTFNHLSDRNYIVFLTTPNQLVLSQGDEVSFLFDNQNIIKFPITESSYKSTKEVKIGSNEKLFENKVLITNDQLNTFKVEKFLNWKIYLAKNNISHIGGEIYVGNQYLDTCKYQTKNHQQIVIQKLASNFQEVLSKEIPEFLGHDEEVNFKLKDSLQSEEYYVYLMIDLSNNFHKIGISNNPQYREFTLQSEKPTIELLASKKFINRKIAKSFESALHSAYLDKRLRGEWFKLDNDEVAEVSYTLSN